MAEGFVCCCATRAERLAESGAVVRSRAGIWLGAALAGAATASARPAASSAANPASVKTGSASYSCDFSGYGSGITPATVTVGWQVNDSWPVNNPDDILLGTTDALPLPSQVSSALGGVDSFEL